jgi:hypothetical protein
MRAGAAVISRTFGAEPSMRIIDLSPYTHYPASLSEHAVLEISVAVGSFRVGDEKMIFGKLSAGACRSPSAH